MSERSDKCEHTFHRLGGIDDCPVCNPLGDLAKPSTAEPSACPKCGLKGFNETRRVAEYCQCEPSTVEPKVDWKHAKELMDHEMGVNPEPSARTWHICTNADDGYTETWITKPGDEYGFDARVKVIEYSAFERLQAKLKEFDEYYTFQNLELVEKERDKLQTALEAKEAECAGLKGDSAINFRAADQARAELAEANRDLSAHAGVCAQYSELVAVRAELAALKDTPGGKRMYAAWNEIQELKAELAIAKGENDSFLKLTKMSNIANAYEVERVEIKLAAANAREARLVSALEDLGSRWRKCTHNEECQCMELKDFARDALAALGESK